MTSHSTQIQNKSTINSMRIDQTLLAMTVHDNKAEPKTYKVDANTTAVRVLPTIIQSIEFKG